jgi:hypothetical protein
MGRAAAAVIMYPLFYILIVDARKCGRFPKMTLSLACMSSVRVVWCGVVGGRYE